MLTPKAAYLKARVFERFTALHVKKRTPPSVYIRHVCCFLCEHTELLEQPDYKKMYDVLMDYLLAYSIDLFKDDEQPPSSEQEYRELTERYIALFTALPKKSFERYPKREIDAYLKHLKDYGLI